MQASEMRGRVWVRSKRPDAGLFILAAAFLGRFENQFQKFLMVVELVLHKCRIRYVSKVDPGSRE